MTLTATVRVTACDRDPLAVGHGLSVKLFAFFWILGLYSLLIFFIFFAYLFCIFCIFVAYLLNNCCIFFAYLAYFLHILHIAMILVFFFAHILHFFGISGPDSGDCCRFWYVNSFATQQPPVLPPSAQTPHLPTPPPAPHAIRYLTMENQPPEAQPPRSPSPERAARLVVKEAGIAHCPLLPVQDGGEGHSLGTRSW